MTRRAGTSSAETRERILAVATEEFATEAYAKTSLRKICTKANVTTGALYFFFESKEDLFRSAIAPVCNKMAELAKEHFSLEFGRNGTPEDEITTASNLARHIHAIYSENTQAAEAFIRNYNHPIVVDLKNTMVEKISVLIRNYLGLDGKTIFASAEHDSLAMAWLATLELDALMHMLHSSPNEEAVSHEAAFVLKFLRGGINALIMQEKELPA